MRRFTIALALATVSAFTIGLLSVYAGPDDDKKKEKQAKPSDVLCPVTGNPVDFTASTMTRDGPVYFCCPGCDKKLKADPEKYAKQVAQQRAVLAKLPRVQVSCPVSGKPIDKEVFTERGGQKVNFCCKGCPERFQKAPAKYEAKLAASYTYQTKCPVMGEDIDPAASTTLKSGQKIYFCCEKCMVKFLENPAKYTPNLEKQGYGIRPEDVKAGADHGKKKEGGDKKGGHEGRDD